MRKNKPRWLLSTVSVFLLTISLVLMPATIQGQVSTQGDTTLGCLERDLVDSSTHILTGTVVSVESKWVNITEGNMIYSYASIYVEKYLKSNDFAPELITLSYEGGIVGNTCLIVFINPWGTIKCIPGQYVKAFAKQHFTSSEIFEAYRVDVITESGSMMSTSSSSSIDEAYGIGFEYYGIHWGNLPVHYSINSLGTEDIPGDLERQAVIDSFQTWEDDLFSFIDFTYDGTTGRDPDTEDGFNVIGWWNLGSGGPIAYTHVWCWWWWDWWKIREFDIVFNDYYNWCIGAEPNKYDVQNVGTHEAGHSLYLLDLYLDENSEQTMYWHGEYNEIKKRTLESGDLAGVQYIYPEHEKPTVSIEQPYEGQMVSGWVEIIAYAACGDGIQTPEFKVHGYEFSWYYTQWTSMFDQEYDYWSGYWRPGGYLGSHFYITVRAKSNLGIYGYDTIMIEYMYD